MSTGKTAVFGTTFVDCKGNVFADYNKDGRNLGRVSFVHGGVGRNVAEDMAMLGNGVTFCATVDKTGLGREVCDRLESEGIDISAVTAVDNGMGMWLVIIDKNGDQQGSVSHMPELAAYESYVAENARRIVSESDGVVLELDLNAEIASTVISAAEEYNVPVFGITGNMSVVLAHREYLASMACYICNDTEAGKLFGTDLIGKSPAEILEITKKEAAALSIPSMVVTLGAEGSVYCDFTSGEYGICPAEKAAVADTCGAGDAFFAGAVSALLAGKSLPEAVRTGTYVAARVIETSENTLYRVKREALAI